MIWKVISTKNSIQHYSTLNKIFILYAKTNVRFFRIIFLYPKIGPNLFYDTAEFGCRGCFLFTLTHSPNRKLIYKKVFVLCRVGFLFEYLKKALAYIFIHKGFWSYYLVFFFYIAHFISYLEASRIWGLTHTKVKWGLFTWKKLLCFTIQYWDCLHNNSYCLIINDFQNFTSCLLHRTKTQSDSHILLD